MSKFTQLFTPDKLLFRITGAALDIVLLSLLWLVVCIPIFTIGPATSALYYSIVKCVRRGEDKPYKNFFYSFKLNFKVGALCTLIALAAALFIYWVYFILAQVVNALGDTSAMMLVAFYIILIIPVGTLLYMFPVLSRFTYGVAGLIAISFKLSMKHLLSTIVIILLNVQAVMLCLRYLAPALIAPALSALLTSLFLERIFKKYTPAPAATDALPEGPEFPTPDARLKSDEDKARLPWYLR